jgi:hypothetical protein
MSESSSASLAELREHLERLANAMQKVDRRLGHPEGFGMLASVTTAFDGLRYLHEVLEERNAKFVEYPYQRLVKESQKRLVKELQSMDSQLSTLQTVDRWAEEATELRRMNAVLSQLVTDLKHKTVRNLVHFYQKFTTPGSAVPGDLLSSDVSRLQSAVSALESGNRL